MAFPRGCHPSQLGVACLHDCARERKKVSPPGSEVFFVFSCFSALCLYNPTPTTHKQQKAPKSESNKLSVEQMTPNQGGRTRISNARDAFRRATVHPLSARQKPRARSEKERRHVCIFPVSFAFFTFPSFYTAHLITEGGRQGAGSLTLLQGKVVLRVRLDSVLPAL